MVLFLCPFFWRLFDVFSASHFYQQVVVSKIMPMTNTTGISEAERMVVEQWFESGARTDQPGRLKPRQAGTPG